MYLRYTDNQYSEKKIVHRCSPNKHFPETNSLSLRPLVPIFRMLFCFLLNYIGTKKKPPFRQIQIRQDSRPRSGTAHPAP